MTLSEFVKQYRQQHDMSIRAFASFIGMSPQQICNIERELGSSRIPFTSTMNTYTKIAEAVGMSEVDFLNLLNDNVRVNPSDEIENMPIIEVDGHTMLDLSKLSEEQRNAINLLLQADQEALSSALPEIESLVSEQQVQDGQQ